MRDVHPAAERLCAGYGEVWRGERAWVDIRLPARAVADGSGWALAMQALPLLLAAVLCISSLQLPGMNMLDRASGREHVCMNVL